MKFQKDKLWKQMQSYFNMGMQWVIEHNRIVLPAALVVVVALVVLVALSIGNKDNELQQDITVSQVGEENIPMEEGIALPETGLELNAYVDVNNLIMAYYNAVASGDVETVKQISNYVEDAEEKRIAELSKYVDSFPSVLIYTKPGPIDHSYLAYVYTLVKFVGYDSSVPGMQAFYVCTNEDGSLYINEGEESEPVMAYIQGVSLQEDVVELYNKMTVEYNELLLADEQMAVFLQELAKQIDIAVGEEIAGEMAAQAEETVEESEVEEVVEETQEEPKEETPSFGSTTTTINVRSSDSETADKLGKLSGGTQVQILESRPNGWSKIIFEDKEAYVKTEYLELAESAEGAEVIGTVTATANVNIRSSASETASKIGIVSGGEKMDLIEKLSNGWCKIKYNNQVGYVKSDYVQE